LDARDTDFSSQSALASYDGDVIYPAIMDATKRDPLNQNDVDGYEEH
jgi:hypothetical protein